MMAFGNPVERRARSRGEPAFGERVIGNKGDPGFGADVDQAIGGPVAQIVGVLDRDDLGDSAGALEPSRRDV